MEFRKREKFWRTQEAANLCPAIAISRPSKALSARNGRVRPCYWSCSQNPYFRRIQAGSLQIKNALKSEQNYPIHDKELFAIVHALKKWRCYLEGIKHLTILMDHKSLEFLKTQSKLNCCQAGWMETLGNFNFNLTYRPGCELLQADALSRIYVQQRKSDHIRPWLAHVVPTNQE